MQNTGFRPIDKITMRESAETIVMVICFIKIALAVLFLQGERKAAGLLMSIYPLRLCFYYNPWEINNQNQEKLRLCYQQIQSSIFMISALLLVLSSQNYGKTKAIKDFNKWIIKQFKNMARLVKDIAHDLTEGI